MHAAVAEDGEVVAETDFGDGDAGEEIRFLRAVESGGQGGKDRVVLVGIISELGNGLGDQDIEPVERFGLMRVDVIVGFGEDSACGEASRGAEDVGRTLGVQFLGCRGRVDGDRTSVG